MAENKKAIPEVDKVRAYVEGVAKSLVDRLYGPTGPAWGTKFSEIEETVAAVRKILTWIAHRAVFALHLVDVSDCSPLHLAPNGLCAQSRLTEGMLHQTLERQAAQAEPPPEYSVCPGCGRPTRPGDGLEPRRLETGGGDAVWEEPKARCDKCRRDFFPSEQEFGD